MLGRQLFEKLQKFSVDYNLAIKMSAQIALNVPVAMLFSRLIREARRYNRQG